MEYIEDKFISLRNRKLEKEPLLSSAIINSYLDERLKVSDKKLVESAIIECPKSKALFDLKKAEREFVLDLIPFAVYDSTNRKKIIRELSDVAKAVLVEPSDISAIKIAKKIYKFLTTPVV